MLLDESAHRAPQEAVQFYHISRYLSVESNIIKNTANVYLALGIYLKACIFCD